MQGVPNSEPVGELLKTMKKRNLTTKRETINREQDPIPWRYCLLTLVCGLLLVVGFFWAARQHFSAMDFGIKNAKLRQQKESLEAEQRRLYLSREISLSPGEIKKVAKKIGLQNLTAESIEVISSLKNSVGEAINLTTDQNKQKPLVNKTSKIERSEKLISLDKKIESEVKKDKDQHNKSQETPSDLRQRVVKK